MTELDRALESTLAILAKVQPADLDAPTPCASWTFARSSITSSERRAGGQARSTATWTTPTPTTRRRLRRGLRGEQPDRAGGIGRGRGGPDGPAAIGEFLAPPCGVWRHRSVRPRLGSGPCPRVSGRPGFRARRATARPGAVAITDAFAAGRPGPFGRRRSACWCRASRSARRLPREAGVIGADSSAFVQDTEPLRRSCSRTATACSARSRTPRIWSRRRTCGPGAPTAVSRAGPWYALAVPDRHHGCLTALARRDRRVPLRRQATAVDA